MANTDKAPTKAPTQSKPVTGGGQVAKTQPTFEHQPPGPMTPPPASAATTGPKIATPSVDYDHGQTGKPGAVTNAGDLYSAEQQQPVQDAAGA